MFSPNGRKIASASFDKSVKVWDGKSGKFVSTLRGHVRAVYQVSWSADGKLLVSGSSDSTVKVRVYFLEICTCLDVSTRARGDFWGMQGEFSLPLPHFGN